MVYDAVVAPTDVMSMQPFDRKTAYELIRRLLETVHFDPGKWEGNVGEITEPPFGIDDEKWVFEFGGRKLDLLMGSITSGNKQAVRLQIKSIFAESTFEKISFFYLCCDCGKIYWNGSHANKHVNNLRDVADLDQLVESDEEME